jgi:quinoprotein glucose dehydrogenase
MVAGLMSLLATAVAVGGTQTGATGGEWHYYGGDAASTRYAPLDQIDRHNVDDLQIAWRWKAHNFGPRPEFNYRTTPLMVNGVLYATAGTRRAVVAIDPASGETLWAYRIDEGERGASAPRPNSGRGVAYWSDGDKETIFLITPAYNLVALSARTGRPVPDFGIDGIVDLRRGLDRDIDIDTARIGSSSPAVVVGDVVVVGNAFPAGSRPPTKEMMAGHIRGYDVRTGERLWIFHTIPEPGEFGHDTWEQGSASYTGNVGVWTTFSADPELGYVYLPLEAPTGDFYGGHRLGDNLFSQSLVCLDAKTGERVWHYQTVRHGIWDYDLPAAPILLDINVDGRPIKAVAQVTKQAFTFVFDRITGDPVWPIEDRAVLQTDVPGERTAPTQPVPTKPAPFDRQGVTIDDLIDFTPELFEEAKELASNFRLGPLFTPPSLIEEDGTKGTLVQPGSLGGANWPSAAADPETGILYVGSATEPDVFGLWADPENSNMRYVLGTGLRLPQGGGPRGLPLLKPPWGRVTAIDLNTGEHVWMKPNGDTPDYVRDHPALRGLDIPATGRADRSAPLVTKTLLFVGEGSGLYAGFGSGGNKLRAYDKLTGEVLAEFELPANQSGVPITYMHEGKQYIVLAVGAAGHPGELVALTLE